MGAYNKLKKLFDTYFKEMFIYGLIGGGAVLIDLGLFWMFMLAGPDDSTYYIYIANIIAISIAVVYSFTLNSIFNFKTRDNLWKRFISFCLVSFIGILISTAILAVASLLGVPPNPAKIISLPFIFITQYTLNRLITFRKGNQSTNENIIETAIEEGDIV